MALDDEDKQWIQGTMQGMPEASEARLREHMYGVETRLLTEFHKWASPMETRVKSHAAAIRAFDEELESLDGRVKRLEEK
jgi:hypothetical protein